SARSSAPKRKKRRAKPHLSPLISIFAVSTKTQMRMKNVIFYIATVCAWAVFQPASAQNADKERLKSNLERAFAPASAAPIPAQNTPQSPDPDKTLFYVQILASVRPLEDT